MRDKWWQHELERQQRAWERERAYLVETICHLSGQPLPIDRSGLEPVQTQDEWTGPSWVASPSQLPDDDL